MEGNEQHTVEAQMQAFSDKVHGLTVRPFRFAAMLFRFLGKLILIFISPSGIEPGCAKRPVQLGQSIVVFFFDQVRGGQRVSI